ncbi:phage virion morphogenesis protein [Pseudotabrizicola algicola]|uniref:Phage virion morphogenesis protein n=1 Tax=Pseudotabrizicola algicola TaxID=2709381 RepID=A0A6B3RND3_9RHOB|nr:phage virion morphogenesis protein [Pseudotabrizicola algicola]NEX47604.1 phage virion morphogenesis protein [Pseudotabrizicola algicola]
MAGVQFTVGLEDAAASRALSALAAASEDMTPLMEEIGRVLVNGAIERIGTTNVGPDGVAWQPSRRATEKGGKTLHDSGVLMRSINAWASPDQVVVGTNVPYAAVHQLGAATGSLGVWVGNDKNGRDMTVLSPWGDIPARPYLGISEEERASALDLVEIRYGAIIEALQ